MIPLEPMGANKNGAFAVLGNDDIHDDDLPDEDHLEDPRSRRGARPDIPDM
jgi:hypothetical protein